MGGGLFADRSIAVGDRIVSIPLSLVISEKVRGAIGARLQVSEQVARASVVGQLVAQRQRELRPDVPTDPLVSDLSRSLSRL